MFVKQFTSKNTFAYRYLPPEEEKQKSKGEVFCLISVSSSYQDDSNRMVKFVWDSLIHEYSQSVLGPLESLKVGLKVAENQLRAFIKNDSKYDGAGIEMSITIVTIRGENAYIAYSGDHSVIIKRYESLIDVSEILRKHKVIAGSTQINQDDLMLIVTSNLKNAVAKDSFDFSDFAQIEKLTGDKEGMLLISKNEIGSEPIIDMAVKEDEVEGNSANYTNRSESDSSEFPNSLENSDENSNENRSENKSGSENIDSAEKLESTEGLTKEDLVIDEVPKAESIEVRKAESLEESSVRKDNLVEKNEEGEGEQTEQTEQTKLPSENKGQPFEGTFEKTSDDTSVLETKEKDAPDLGYGSYTSISETPIGEMPTSRMSGTSGISGISDSTSPEPSTIDPKDKKFPHAQIQKIQNFLSKITQKIKPITSKIKAFFQGKTIKKVWEVIKKTFSMIGKIFGFFADKTGAFFGWIGSKIKTFFDSRFGHKPWYKRIMSKVSMMRVVPGGGNVKGMRIDYYRDENIRRKRIGAVIVVLLIIVAGYFGVKQAIVRGEQKEIHDQVVVIMTEADNYLKQAEADAISNVDSARLNLQKGEEKITQAENLAIWEADLDTIISLKTRAEEAGDTINRRTAVSESNGNFELYMDTKISLGQNSSPTDMMIFRNTLQNEFLFLSDKGEKSAYSISLNDKKVAKIADTNNLVSSPLTIAPGVLVDGELYGVYIFDSTNGVIRSLYENGNYADFKELTGLTGQSIGYKDVTDISILTLNSNVYLMSRTDKAVLKATRDDFGNYGVTQKYIQSDLLAQGNGILADEYYVYTIATGSTGLQRWQMGNEVPFELIGVSPSFQNVTAGFTGELTTHRMYLYDKGDNRIVVLEKPNDATGLHPNQYVMLKQFVYRGDREDVFTDVKALVVDWAEEYLYVLDGLRVWRIKL